MIILDATNKSLQVTLGGTVATNQLPFSASYVDTTGTATIPGEQDGVSNSTTTVPVVAAPASSTERFIKSIVMQNADTAAATVTIIYNNNSTLRNIFVATLAVGDQLIYEDGQGWSALDTNGNIKTSTTLLAPSFGTSVTTPVIYGGTAISSTLTLEGTSNGSPSGANILLNPTSGTGNVGIGTNAPGANLTISTNAVALPPTSDAALLQIGAADTGQASINMDTFSSVGGSILIGRAYNGTNASPSALTSGNLLALTGQAYNGTAMSGNIAAVIMAADGTQTTSSAPTRISFGTTASGSTTRTEAMRITNAGYVGIGTTSPAALLSVGSSSQFQVDSSGDLSTSGAISSVTSITTPTIDGGTASNSTLTLCGTSNGSPSGANICLNPSRQGYVAVGTSNPNYPFTVSANVTVPPAINADTIAQVVNADSVNTRFAINAFGAIPVLTFSRADGTNASPTAVQAGDRLGGVGAEGYDGGAYSGSAAAINFYASETFASAAHGTYVSLFTTTNGAITANEKVRIDNAGNVGINQTTPAYTLDVNGSVNSASGYYANGAAGVSVTITTAKLTSGGSNGSMTFTNGILTAQAPAT